MKLRNYVWFKEYLLHSNIWLCKYDNIGNSNNNNDNDNSQQVPMLYNLIDETTDNALMY